MAVQLEQAPVAEAYRFTIEQYERMVETGIIEEDERVELLEGEIVKMSPIGWPHSFCVNRLTSIFSSFLEQSPIPYIIWSQSPVRLNNNSEPEPDFALIKSRPDLSPASPPTPDDVILLIEVAESSLSRDRGSKLRLYAREGIADYWIVNLPDQVIELHSEAAGGKYAVTHIARRGEMIPLPGELAGSLVAVNDILG